MKNIFFGIALIVSSSAFAADTPGTVLPAHNGKCGDLDATNMGVGLANCKVGDVVTLQGRLLSKYCDYRYQIFPIDGTQGSTRYYSCVLRVAQEKTQ